MHAIRLTYLTVYGWLLITATLGYMLVLGALLVSHRLVAGARTRLRQPPD